MQTLRKKSLEGLTKSSTATEKVKLLDSEFASHVLNNKQLQKFIS